MILRGANEAEIVSYVVDRYKELKRIRVEKELIWVECLRAYLSSFNEEWKTLAVQNGRSARHVGIAHEGIETVHSQLMSMTFHGEDWLRLATAIPGRLQYDDEAAEDGALIVRSQLPSMEFERSWSLVVKQAAILGSSPFTAGWREDSVVDYPAYGRAMEKWRERNRSLWNEFWKIATQWKQAAAAALESGQEAPPAPSYRAPEPPVADTRVAYVGPTIRCGDLFNFVMDSYPVDPKHALRIQRSYVSKAVLKRLAQRNDAGYAVYDNVDDLEEVKISSAAAEEDYLIERHQAFGLDIPETSAVEVKEASGTMEIANGLADGRSTFVSFIATVANDKKLMRFEPTFLWSGELPTQMVTYKEVPGEVYGIGALEPNVDLVDLINARANQLVDVVSFAVNPEFTVLFDPNMDLSAKSGPGKKHLVGRHDALRVIEKNLNGLPIAFSEFESLKRELMLGMNAIVPGGAQRDESATRTGLDANVVGANLGKIARHMESTGLDKAINLIVEMDAQYLTAKQKIRISQNGNPAYREISPEALRANLISKCRGSEHFADKAQRVQNLLMVLQLVQGSPVLLPSVKPLEILRQLMDEMGMKNLNKILRNEQEAQEILEQMVALGLFGNTTGGPGGSTGGSETSGA